MASGKPPSPRVALTVGVVVGIVAALAGVACIREAASLGSTQTMVMGLLLLGVGVPLFVLGAWAGLHAKQPGVDGTPQPALSTRTRLLIASGPIVVAVFAIASEGSEYAEAIRLCFVAIVFSFLSPLFVGYWWSLRRTWVYPGPGRHMRRDRA